MTDTRLDAPRISVVVETSNWERQHRIHLEDTLDALGSQSLPSSAFETIVVLDEPNRYEHERIAAAYPWLRVVDAPAGMSYYEFKNLGASLASREIVALTDADCLPCPTWVEEIGRSFATLPERVVAVQGKTRFLEAPLSRAWEACWWSRAFEDEGPVDRMYTANNIAYRAKVFREHHYIPGTGFKSGLERPLTRELLALGYEIWLNPRMEVVHNYSPKPREIVQQGLVRGYNWMSVRRTYPGRGDRLLRRLGPLGPLVGAAGMLANDYRRVITKAGRLGVRPREAYKVPLYMAALVPFDALALAGMYWAILRPHQAPRRPL